MPPDGYTTLTLPEDAAQRLEELRGDETVGEFVHALADAYEAESAGEAAGTIDEDDLDGLREDLENSIPTLTARELRESTLR